MLLTFGRRRFWRKAELLATLNHPNIAAIQADGMHVLALN
jgi:hypothetical protein